MIIDIAKLSDNVHETAALLRSESDAGPGSMAA